MTCTFRRVYIYLKSLITLNNESSALIFINSISYLQTKYLAKIMSRWLKKIEFYQILPCHLWLAITLGRISLWPCKWEKGHDFTITQYRLHRLHCEQNIKYWWNKILDSWIYYCKISHSEVERCRALSTSWCTFLMCFVIMTIAIGQQHYKFIEFQCRYSN